MNLKERIEYGFLEHPNVLFKSDKKRFIEGFAKRIEEQTKQFEHFDTLYNIETSFMEDPKDGFGIVKISLYYNLRATDVSFYAGGAITLHYTSEHNVSDEIPRIYGYNNYGIENIINDIISYLKNA